MILTGVEFKFHSFEGKDLSKQNLSNSKFIHCNFKDCNLFEADCSKSDFTGSDFTGANLRYTNFARSHLNAIKFYPKDAYGVIFSLDCDTFKNMNISKLWWFSYVYFALIMLPELDSGKDLRDIVIGALGIERYTRLCAMFRTRSY